MKTKRSGFTLVELLVVIAIISLLAGLLLPALNQARQSALAIDCTNRMKNLITFAHTYENDYEVILPTWHTYNTGGAKHRSPAPLYIAGYLDAGDWTKNNPTEAFVQSRRASSIALCPNGVSFDRADARIMTASKSIGGYSDCIPGSAVDMNWDVKTIENQYNGDTTWSDEFLSQVQGWGGWLTFAQDYVQNSRFMKGVNNAGWRYYPIRAVKTPPSLTMFFIEGHANSSGAIHSTRGMSWLEYRGTHAPYRYHRFPHMNGGNYAALDGHVATYARDPFLITTNADDVEELLPFVW